MSRAPSEALTLRRLILPTTKRSSWWILGEVLEPGDMNNFLRVIQEEIKPRITRMVAVDRHRDILFGWSLGGQFVVHTMLTHPETFSTYVALSPSLWWANKRVFTEVPDFEKRIAASGQRVSLWLGVGSLEHEVSPGASRTPVDQEKLAQELIYDKMVGNMLDFSAEVRPFLRSTIFVSLPMSLRARRTTQFPGQRSTLFFALRSRVAKSSDHSREHMTSNQ